MKPNRALKEIKLSFPEKAFPSFAKGKGLEAKLANFTDDEVDMVRGYLRQLDANFNNEVKTSLMSNAQQIGQRLLPVWVFARHFGGQPGRQTANAFELGLLRSRLQSEKYVTRLEAIFKGMKKPERELVSQVREGLIGPQTDRVTRAVDEMGKVLDEVADEVAGFTDRYGNKIRVFNTRTGKWDEFAKHRVSNYFPHRWHPEVWRPKGKAKLRSELLEQGIPGHEVDRMINQITNTTPKRVGHLEVARVPGAKGYLKDPLEVLPKYVNDSFYRIEMAREYGVNNELLDIAMKNLKDRGVSVAWADKLADGIVGRSAMDKWEGQLIKYLTGAQAVAKLGYATSAANFSQIMNQIIHTGGVNFVKSVAQGGVPGFRVANKYRKLGNAAFDRAVREDIVRMGIGVTGEGRFSKFMNYYMRGIGFDWTERAGRHLGAVGGSLDAEDMLGAWWKMSQEGKGASKEAGRLLGELQRKYRISLNQPFRDYVPGTGGTVGDHIRRLGGEVPREILDHAGLRAADKTMHAFNIGELPLGWRDPTWRTLLQFKSFIYKQTDFLMSQVLSPGIKHLATNGREGDIMPLLRASLALPAGAEGVTHLRDWIKSVPSHAYKLATTMGKEGARWDYKKAIWNDPAPPLRYFVDLSYIGTFGLIGDMIEAARYNRLERWMLGPAMTDIADLVSALTPGSRASLGKLATRSLPGALGVPYSANIPKELGLFD
jgi:hypothetical protein